MQMQQHTLMQREDTVEHEILLHGTAKAIREATMEMTSINTVVGAQGETLHKIQKKITDAEYMLKRASKSLSRLLRRSRKRKMLSSCLLVCTVVSVACLCIYAMTK